MSSLQANASKFRRSGKKHRVLPALLVFSLVFSWFFSGWPSLLNFPPQVPEAQAATTGAVYPSLGASVSEAPWSDDTWQTPTNIYADDAATANIIASTFDSGDQSWVLKATGFNFSAIPDTATINGVTMRTNAWYRSGQGSGSIDLCQLLTIGKAKTGTNNCSTPTALTTTNTTIVTKGSGSDLWGLGLTPAWVKHSGFGVALGVLSTAANTDADIDYVTLEVTYTVAGTTLTVSSFASQTFTVGNATTAVSPVRVRESGTSSITAANDIRVKIPAGFNMTWDDADTAADVRLAPTLADYANAYNTTDLAVITADNSGVTYNPLTDTLFFVTNGIPTIYEFQKDGTHLRTITMSNFIDTEGIAWMYGTTYAVTEERDPYDIIIVTIDAGTTTLDKNTSTVINPAITFTSNLGFEGIAYDPDNDWFYLVAEKQAAGGNGGRVFKVERNATVTEYTTLGTNLLAMGVTDLADIAYDPASGNLFLLSQENNLILEVTTAGSIIRTRATDPLFLQPEGLAFSQDGNEMYVAGEVDDYQRLTRTAKVSSTVSYEDSNKTLVVNVTTNFSGSDALYVTGLSYENFSAASAADNLELEVANNNVTAATDDKTITINTGASISSLANQTFAVGDSASTISQIYITEGSSPQITAANDIRVKIPAGFNMSWDDTDTSATLAMSPTLPDYTNAFNTNDLAVITGDNSGVTYSPVTDTLFFIINGTPTIYEFQKDGTHLRTITMSNFIDTEGLTWMHGTTFAIAEERAPNDIIIVTIAPGTTSLDKNNGTIIDPNISVALNLGMEGITYDAANNWFYVAVEKQANGNNGGRVYKVEMNGTVTELATLGTNLSAAGITDLADIYYDGISGHLFLLSHENTEVLEVTTTGTIVDTFDVDTGIFTQPEGLSFSPDGNEMYIAGELDDYQRLTRTPKVSSTVSFEDANKTLVLDVTSSFSGSEILVVSDLKFKSFTAASAADNLELETANNNTTVSYDDKTKEIVSNGSLSVDIVDGSYAAVGSPSMAMTTATLSIVCQTVTGSFGTPTQQIYVNNNDLADNGWVLTLAAQAATNVWDSAGTDYDFNDPTSSGCGDGADADSVGGQMTVDPSVATLAVGQCGGCVTTNISKGSETAFSQGVTDSITLLSAAAGSDDIGDWTLRGVVISQKIPAAQPVANDYDINMVLTVTAS